jgi:hypothetical protein
MVPISLCWPTALEVDAGTMAVEVEPSQFVSFVAMRKIAAVWQNGI